MAFYPCSIHGHMYTGAAQAAYPALVDGAESERVHLRMCAGCFRGYVEHAEEKLREVIGGPAPLTDAFGLCCMCGGAPGRTKLFITVYPKSADPRQFFGAVCATCVDPARSAWLGADVAA